MSHFIGQLKLRSLSVAELAKAGSPDKQLYELLEAFSYQSDKLGFTVTAPVGMVTDFASVPRAVWNIIDPEDPRIGWGSVIHDVLYKLQGDLGAGLPIITREQADATLRECMEVCGASNWIRSAVYWALRAGGASAWNNPTIYET